MKIPLFCVSHSSLSSAQIEAILCTHHVLPQFAMYSDVAQSLPIEAAEEVRDLIEEIPVGDSYNILNYAIMKSTGLSDCQSLDTRFTNVEMGDWKSQIFRYMKQLLGSQN